jgi:hypothetical protein
MQKFGRVEIRQVVLLSPDRLPEYDRHHAPEEVLFDKQRRPVVVGIKEGKPKSQLFTAHHVAAPLVDVLSAHGLKSVGATNHVALKVVAEALDHFEVVMGGDSPIFKWNSHLLKGRVQIAASAHLETLLWTLRSCCCPP